jgi:uncharacterized protein (TIGR02246 family)
MSARDPLETVAQIVRAINRGDLDGAAAVYEPGACLVAQPGRVATGRAEVRNALAGFIALKPILELEAQELVQAGDLALYCSTWRLRGRDPEGNEVRMGGRSADVLRRHADGTWRIAVDNPWGTEILG